jgi:Ca-activated chloride channel family protein
MGLVAPLGLLGLALLAPIIAMYLLKRRRDEVAVSSVYLWERVVQDMEANAPWQKLRRNLLLLLQLLFLLAAIFGLARPFLLTAGAAGQSLIVVVDTSVSMGANDTAEGTRLDSARAETLRLMDGLPDGGRISVIRAGGGAEILAANTTDRLAVQSALDGLTASARDSDLTQALTLAAAAAERTPDSELVILSDGGVQLPPTLALDRPVRYIPIGASGENQAISTLSLTRVNTDTYDVFVQVTNHGSAESTRRLVLEQDGRLFTATDVTMPAGQSATKLLQVRGVGSFTLSARLEGADNLASDDVAFAVPGVGGNRTVRLLTPSADNRFLRVPFQLLPNVQFSMGNPLTDTAEVDGSTADLLVLDRWLPDEGLPGTTENLLIIAPPAGNDIIQTTGVYTNPLPIKMNTVPGIEDSLFFDSDIFFVEAKRGTVPVWGTVVLEDGITGDPLLWIGDFEGRRIAVLNLAIYGQPESIEVEPPRELVLTNFVYNPGFPVLMVNLANYLLAGPAGGLAGQSVEPGTVVNLPLLDSTEVTVIAPNGQRENLRPIGEERTVRYLPSQAGVYQVEWGNSSTQQPIAFTVNLFLPRESDITPQPELALATTGGTAPGEIPESTETRQEFWRPLLLIGLIVLTAEWLVYQRDAIVTLRRRWQKRTA